MSSKNSLYFEINLNLTIMHSFRIYYKNMFHDGVLHVSWFGISKCCTICCWDFT